MSKKKNRRGNRPQTQQSEFAADNPPPPLSPEKEAEIANLYYTFANVLRDHPAVLSEIAKLIKENPTEETLPIHLQRMSRALRDFPHLFEQYMSILPPALRARASQTSTSENADASDGRNVMVTVGSSHRAEVRARASATLRAPASMPTSMHAATSGHYPGGPQPAYHGYGGLPYRPIVLPVTWRICEDCAKEMLEERQKEEEKRKLRALRDMFRHYFPDGERVLADTLWLIVGLAVVGVLVKVYL